MSQYQVERGVRINKSQLEANSYNPNKTTQRQQEAIGESLQTYGQLTSVLVRPHPEKEGKYVIVDGEHRSQELGEDVYVDVVHGLSDADAKKLTIIMNETRGEADKIELAQLLADINADMGLEELGVGLPYDEVELNELVKLADINWDEFGSVGGEDTSADEPATQDDDEEDWITLTARMPMSAVDVFNQAQDLIRDEDNLHEDKAIALGQVLERLAADFLAK